MIFALLFLHRFPKLPFLRNFCLLKSHHIFSVLMIGFSWTTTTCMQENIKKRESATCCLYMRRTVAARKSLKQKKYSGIMIILLNKQLLTHKKGAICYFWFFFRFSLHIVHTSRLLLSVAKENVYSPFWHNKSIESNCNICWGEMKLIDTPYQQLRLWYHMLFLAEDSKHCQSAISAEWFSFLTQTGKKATLFSLFLNLLISKNQQFPCSSTWHETHPLRRWFTYVAFFDTLSPNTT